MDQGSSEKTEKATPKKRNDARKKGQVLKSAEVNTAVLTLSMFITLAVASGFLIRRLCSILVYYFQKFPSIDHVPNQDMIHDEFTSAVFQMLLALLPFLLVGLIAGIAVNIAQVGFLFVTDPLIPKFSKINPMAGLKRMFSMRTLMELFKTVAKVGVVGLVVYFEYKKDLDEFPMMLALPIASAGKELFNMCLGVAFRAAFVLVVIGLIDYLYQWYEFEKNLRMSKEEVKQEFKQMEGDPQIKGKRREIQRRMSMLRMMSAVPQADVVITNPTHYAVALKYDSKEADAPIVLAKGKDNIAQRIKKLAAESNIQIVENKPVAQALYASCEPGQKIPAELFAAVAEILAEVYKIKAKT